MIGVPGLKNGVTQMMSGSTLLLLSRKIEEKKQQQNSRWLCFIGQKKIHHTAEELILVSLIRLLNVLNIGYSSIFFVVFLDPFCFVFVFL